jgi:hypothetical protein
MEMSPAQPLLFSIVRYVFRKFEVLGETGEEVREVKTE